MVRNLASMNHLDLNLADLSATLLDSTLEADFQSHSLILQSHDLNNSPLVPMRTLPCNILLCSGTFVLPSPPFSSSQAGLALNRLCFDMRLCESHRSKRLVLIWLGMLWGHLDNPSLLRQKCVHHLMPVPLLLLLLLLL
jgi:hypothetical protein